MLEKPNLNYIKDISEGDKNFENSLLLSLKTEFPKEYEILKNNFKQQNYLKVALNLHKLKHKISMLGMPLAFEITYDFEQDIKKGHTEQYETLLVVLDKINVYLSSI